MNEDTRRDLQPTQPAPPPSAAPRRRLSPVWTVWRVIAAVIVIALVIIGFQNNQDVRVALFFWAFHIALAWALLIALVLGLILGWSRPHFWPRRRS